ncbi:unnamed protein product [Meganyctiphanes norvegica]|uniref:Uncharacterized protein n=1 Tax=Meganyctiphanes norvegica TaxID=48144 RepID=A0AAV2Q5Y4_MEGNR
MGVFDPKRCCCFSMRTGILFLGVVSLIYAVVNLLLTPYLFDMKQMLDNITENWPDKYKEHKDNIVFTAVISNEVSNAFLLLVSCLLIHGIRKDRPSLLIPFMVWTVTFIILAFVGIVLLLFVVISVQPSTTVSELILALAFITCLQICNVIAINAYYKQVRYMNQYFHIGSSLGSNRLLK